jgi:hypothetical protein
MHTPGDVLYMPQLASNPTLVRTTSQLANVRGPVQNATYSALHVNNGRRQQLKETQPLLRCSGQQDNQVYITNDAATATCSIVLLTSTVHAVNITMHPKRPRRSLKSLPSGSPPRCWIHPTPPFDGQGDAGTQHQGLPRQMLGLVQSRRQIAQRVHHLRHHAGVLLVTSHCVVRKQQRRQTNLAAVVHTRLETVPEGEAPVQLRQSDDRLLEGKLVADALARAGACIATLSNEYSSSLQCLSRVDTHPVQPGNRQCDTPWVSSPKGR